MSAKPDPAPGVHYVTVKSKVVYFTFNERFGPLVTDRIGDPLETQPVHENHPFWLPFTAWLSNHNRRKGGG